MAHSKQNKDRYVVGKTLSNGTAIHKGSTLLNNDTRKELAEPIKKSSKKKWFFFILFVLLITPLATIATWNAYNYSRASQKILGTSNLLAALSPASIDRKADGRINVMIVGFSKDDPDHEGANLTDSIMIVSLSTTDKKGYMLSIPRDLYVSIPGSGNAKINEAYQDGEMAQFNESGYPKGGMGLLEKTISESLGIDVDYYALVNYAAVRDTTNALNGITVNVQSPDPRGIYDPNFPEDQGGPLRLTNGVQKIDGQTALRLTRARGAAGDSYGLAQSDFDRTKNQQAVLTGLKNAVDWNVLLNPLNNKKLLEGVASNIVTNIEINEVLPVYKVFRSVPASEMKSLTLRDINGRNLLASYGTPYGQSALIPAAGINDYSDIQSAINSLNNQ